MAKYKHINNIKIYLYFVAFLMMFCIPYLQMTFQLLKSDDSLSVYFLIVQDNYPFFNYLNFFSDNNSNAEGAST